MPASLLFVLSPAKALDMDPAPDGTLQSEPRRGKECAELVSVMKKKSAAELRSMSGLSGPLGDLNRKRWQQWDSAEAKQACLAFDGPAFRGLGAKDFTKDQQEYLQKHLRILSGLYGTLRPYDAIKPYRLEMGTKVATKAGRDLYSFWGDSISKSITEELASMKHHPRVLVSCASQEYFRSVQQPALGKGVSVVTCEFPGAAVYAKKARGMMVRYAALNNVTSVEGLKGFRGYGDDGYVFSKAQSNDSKLVFLRQGKGEGGEKQKKGGQQSEKPKPAAKKSAKPPPKAAAKRKASPPKAAAKRKASSPKGAAAKKPRTEKSPAKKK
eukprot:TRINITY_DN7186_c0_g1_i1.p1 TRINITY_DN7186_c0_g1~~TRINITY_DN7186_c0_g1_i1.p1  ORF type:complete len:350 (+),score=128.92 TRINITY_DN7186_c0_g1_i1:74-1051(+)